MALNYLAAMKSINGDLTIVDHYPKTNLMSSTLMVSVDILMPSGAPNECWDDVELSVTLPVPASRSTCCSHMALAG